ncbi:MAG TPA: GNAT family N-acetyltransferase [Usitatibacter sp.]|nr:GNAT family N-acetyltransferase [Usitatibacter sp.]
MERRRPLFAAGAYRCDEMPIAEVARLQDFFDANPEYFVAVEGAPPGPGAAREEFESLPPADYAFERKYTLGFEDGAGSLVANADVVSHLLAKDVWHVGLFIVATRLHGSGAARSMYGALEDWMAAGGARWSRLGVVAGNARAERFWERMGYVEVRKRRGVRMGQRVNDLRVMVKPLGGSLAEYLELVPRDREA